MSNEQDDSEKEPETEPEYIIDLASPVLFCDRGEGNPNFLTPEAVVNPDFLTPEAVVPDVRHC